MSARTAPLHTPAELTLLSCDHTTGIVAFTAPSASQAGQVNVVLLDTTNGDTLCNCKGAECGRRCWHLDHVAAAWQRTAAMAQVRWLTDAALVRYGTKARLCVDTYAARVGRVLPADALSLVAARCEYRLRAARAAAQAAPLALAA